MNSVVRTATSLASEAGRFSQMLTTQIVEKTKEVGIPAHLYETAEEKTADILPGLNSKVVIQSLVCYYAGKVMHYVIMHESSTRCLSQTNRFSSCTSALKSSLTRKSSML